MRADIFNEQRHAKTPKYLRDQWQREQKQQPILRTIEKEIADARVAGKINNEHLYPGPNANKSVSEWVSARTKISEEWVEVEMDINHLRLPTASDNDWVEITVKFSGKWIGLKVDRGDLLTLFI